MVKTEASMDRVVFLIDRTENGGFVAACATHGIFSQGDRIADLSALLDDPVVCHLGDSAKRTRIFVKWADNEDPVALDVDG